MLLSNNKKVWIPLVVAGIAFLLIAIWYSEFYRPYDAAIQTCAIEKTNETERIDCWYSVMRDIFDEKGTAAAFETFVDIYNEYPDFANTGCHRHAHRIGDMSYYFDYMTHRDLGKVDFPKKASTCGYGFYHGFFEHLVQDIPDINFVTETCNFLEESIFENAPAIQQTCYHGSGHGFVLSVVDTLTDPKDWSPDAFTREPLEFCDALPEADERERAECRQGVFNVLVDWMDDGEYGLTYNSESPFHFCERQTKEHKPDCIYEMAQKIDRLSDFDPRKMVAFAQQVSDPSLQDMIMSVGGAALVQHDPIGDKSNLLAACLEIEGALREGCIKGILGGMVEHGVTGDYTTAVNFCESDMLEDADRTTCYEELFRKLSRFETRDSIEGMCSKKDLAPRFCERLDTFRK